MLASLSDNFIEKSKKIHGDKYLYDKVNYVNNRIDVVITCKKHGDFKQEPRVHLRGSGCNLCNLENRRRLYQKEKEDFISQSINIHGDRYSYDKVNYINNRTPVIIICKNHGEFSQKPYSHLNQKSGCPICANKNTNTSIFVFKCLKKFGNLYDYSLVEYKHHKEKVNVICNKGHVFSILPSQHLQGTGCSICRESLGERIVSKYLSNKKIKFIRQKRFKDCRFQRPLPFDFYLPDYNTCIEFDGEQHFNKFRFELDESRLIKTKKRDIIKNNFCEKNNINLLRIKFNQNIESILDIHFSNEPVHRTP